MTCGPEPTPESLAHALRDHAREVAGEEGTRRFLITVVREIFAIEPRVLDYFVTLWKEDMRMIELPRGLWKWISENGRDVARIAAALEQIAEEIARIRKTLQDDQKEDK